MASTIRYPSKQFQFINFLLISPFMIMTVQKVNPLLVLDYG